MKNPFGLFPLKRPSHFKFGVYDFEAENWWNVKRVGFYDGKNYYAFCRVADFLDFVVRRKYRGWRFFAHNAGRYDANFLFDYIRKNRPHGIKMRFYCSGSAVIGMVISKGKLWVKFVDSFRLLPASQKALTEAFDVEHKKGELDIESLEYNRTDCLGLYETLTRFFEETGAMAETFASHALRVFRAYDQREPLWIPPRWTEELSRGSYFGGRTEVFRKAGRVRSYDVNSMYPWAMTLPVPVKYSHRSRRLDLPENQFGFYRADVDYPMVEIPALPVSNGKLFFPVGKFSGYWSHLELQQAIDDGAKIRVRSGAVFHSEPIFNDYVARLYKLKQGADEPMRTIAKFLLNSLYGKFGQKREKRMFELWHGQNGFYPLLAPDGSETGICYQVTTSQAPHLLCHISAAITSRARLRHLAGLRSVKVWYGDTDSLFTDDKLETGPGLGEWSEDKPIQDARFYQPKLYRHGDIWKKKGLSRIPSDQMQIYVDRSLAPEDRRVSMVRRKSILEASRDGKDACMDVETVKTLRDGKPKRCFSGNESRPWIFDGAGGYA